MKRSTPQSESESESKLKECEYVALLAINECQDKKRPSQTMTERVLENEITRNNQHGVTHPSFTIIERSVP